MTANQKLTEAAKRKKLERETLKELEQLRLKALEPRTVGVPEAARLTEISVPGYYAAAKRGEVPGRYIGRRIVVPKVQLEKFLAGEPWKAEQLVPASDKGSTP